MMREEHTAFINVARSCGTRVRSFGYALGNLVHSLLLVCLFLFLGGGCSRSVGCGERSDGCDLARDLEGFSRSFETGDGAPIRRGESILEKIANFPGATCRTNGLAQFRKTIFATEFSGGDYAKLRSGLGAMEHLQPSYLSAAYLCGLGLDENIGYRIDFLKWLRREMARPHDADTNDAAGAVPGPYVSRLFVSREAYQNSLEESYKLHLRWMEEAFNQASTLPEFSNGVDSVRLRIEQFLGRPIRTDEELRRESGMK